ncbi:hypothetical protein PIB30_025265 [Stylosanthes scabra]|uniref:Uncharacterized protein n=1 Tax=Stylosanthes scabra TaxID=79078 RepID=A0ABU6TA88_9FABA|nr:hypothetical protein [Stylosanthes scabra]
MTQPSKDHQAARLLAWRIRLDRVRKEDVIRQLGANQPVPPDPVNVDFFLMTTSRGEDVWWLTHHTTIAWHES